MSGPQSFAVDVDGPACADALAAQRDRAYRCQGRQVLTPDRLAKLKPPPCDSLSRTTPFALFQRALACPEALDGPRLQLKCGASPSPCTLSRWERDIQGSQLTSWAGVVAVRPAGLVTFFLSSGPHGHR